MNNIIEFHAKDRIEYDSCNTYWFSPIESEENSLNCVFLYDFENGFYRLNVYLGNDQNLFSNLFRPQGLSFEELFKILSIYEISPFINDGLRERIKNEPNTQGTGERHDVVIPQIVWTG